jgi:hypothetical protein
MTTPTIHVIATTAVGTEAALRAAVLRAIQHDARVVLLVPHTASGDLGGSFLRGTTVVDEYDDIVKRVAHPVQIRLCMTPNPSEAVTHLIPTHARVFLGGPTSVWWPTVEERLAARLRRSGREVVFVGCNTGRPGLETGVHLNA